MKVRVRYKIEMIREEDTDNWESKTPEDLIKAINKHVQEDIDFLVDDIMASPEDKITVEEVKE